MRIFSLAALISVCALIGAGSASAAPNTAPVINLPFVTTDVDAALVMSGSNAISVTDPDSGSGTLDFTLLTSQGTYTLASTSGLQFLAGDGVSDTQIVIRGTLTDINAALNGMTFTPNPGYSGPAETSVAVNDGGNTGDDGPKSDFEYFTIGVGPNDAPVITVPSTQTIAEDTTLTFSTANSNAITIDDDSGENLIQVTINANFGTVTLPDTSNLTFSNGDGANDTSMTFKGKRYQINTRLNSLQFTPDANHNNVNGSGTSTVTVSVDDLQSSGTGSALTDSETVGIDVTAVNDAPVNNLPVGVGTYKNVDKYLSWFDLNQISLTEHDGPNNPATLEISLTVEHGTITFDDISGLTFTAGDGTDDAAMTFSATYGDANAALDDIVFSPETDFYGDASITIDTDDLGNTGTGGALSDVDTLTIRVDKPQPTVYWASAKPVGRASGAIGRADLDGDGGVNLITGPSVQDTPTGVAIDLVGERIYFMNTPTSVMESRIYSTKLDGSELETFLAPGTAPSGTVLSGSGALQIDADSRRIYWSNTSNTTTNNRGIFWADIDNPTTGGAVAAASSPPPGATVSSIRGFSIDKANNRVYWTNRDAPNIGGDQQSLSFAPLSGAGDSGNFTISGLASNDDVESASGVVTDPATGRIFWGNSLGGVATERIKVATLNGTSSITGSAFNIGSAAGGSFRGLAIDSSDKRLYWSNGADNSIAYAKLTGDGSASGTIDTGDAFVASPDQIAIVKYPEVSTAPAISGTPQVGQTLTCAPPTWHSDAINQGLYRMATDTYFAGWMLGSEFIDGADSPTYTPTVPGEYRCKYGASNFAGSVTSKSEIVTVTAVEPPALPAHAASAIVPKWKSSKTHTVLSSLAVTDVAAGSTITVTCKAKKKKGCPFKSKKQTVATATPTKKITLFARKKLPVGTVVTVRVTAPGSKGRQSTYTVRKSKKPKVVNVCLSPSGSKTTC